MHDFTITWNWGWVHIFTKSAIHPRSVSGDEWRMLFAQAKACVYP